MNPRINALLDGLPDVEYTSLVSRMELVSLSKGQNLFEIGQLASHVYYPVGALISIMVDLADGYSAETYMVGRAGVSGWSALDTPSRYRANVRHAGLAYRLAGHVHNSLLPSCPNYSQSLLIATRRMALELSQGMICSKHHSVEQQLIRWMLISVEHLLEPVIRMTHQEIAERLGFRREAITLALGKLAALEHICVERGVIELTQRAGLESMACECYWSHRAAPRPELHQLELVLR